jgi:hypothetical protein
MWAPWQVSVVTGGTAGFASALPQLHLGAHHAISGGALVAGIICLVTWFGLWLSRRPKLAFFPALGVASASAIIALLASLPIETHAEVVDSPGALGNRVHSMRDAYLIGVYALALPALIAFVAGAHSACRLTPRWSGRVRDKVPSPDFGVRAAQLNR